MVILLLQTLRRESIKLSGSGTTAISGEIALERFLVDDKEERLSDAARRVLNEKGKIVAIIELSPHDGTNPYFNPDGCGQSLWLVDLREDCEDSTGKTPPYLLVSTLGGDDDEDKSEDGYVELFQGETLHIGRLSESGSFRPDNAGRFSCNRVMISRHHFDIKCDLEGNIWITDLSKYGTRIVVCK